VIARAVSVPFALGAGIAGRTELPDGGWDDVIHWALVGCPAKAVSALEIMVLRPYRGAGCRS
jgi:hypothetical protein